MLTRPIEVISSQYIQVYANALYVNNICTLKKECKNRKQDLQPLSWHLESLVPWPYTQEKGGGCRTTLFLERPTRDKWGLCCLEEVTVLHLSLPGSCFRHLTLTQATSDLDLPQSSGPEWSEMSMLPSHEGKNQVPTLHQASSLPGVVHPWVGHM